jgi:hypothetical protein
MSCSEPINIVKGNIVNIPITLRLDVLSYVFTCSGIVTAPAVNGETTTTAQFVVTSVVGLVVTMQSLLASNTDDNGATIISATGTLTRSTGTGDATLTYTSFTTDNYVDTTSKTIKMRILREVVDSPAVADIIADKNATMTAKGTGFFQFSVAETSTYPVGTWYGVIEVYSSANNIIEQNDNEVFPVIINKNKV